MTRITSMLHRDSMRRWSLLCTSSCISRKISSSIRDVSSVWRKALQIQSQLWANESIPSAYRNFIWNRFTRKVSARTLSGGTRRVWGVRCCARFLSQIGEVYRISGQQRREFYIQCTVRIRTAVLLQTQRSLGIDFAIFTRFAHHGVLHSYFGSLHTVGFESIFILLLHHHSNDRLWFSHHMLLLVSASSPCS